jgi:class 3 adenylate cyclase
VSRPPAKSEGPEPGSVKGSSPKLDLSQIRHDLRTPINHILGYCELLQEDEHTPASFQPDLRKIHAGGRKLVALMTEYFDDELFESRRHNLFQLCHELRTPVNHIIGYGEMLQEQAEDLGLPKLLADLQKITGAARLWLASMEARLVTPGTSPPQARPQKPEVLTTGSDFAPPAPVAQTDPSRAANRLLVVDDDEANRELLARRLRQQGFTPTVAGGGVEALQALRAQPFDLVLLDLVMPGLDGYEVLTRMKSDPVLAALPVIMISAMDQAEGIARCLEAGAEDYLPKPFDPVLLRARVGAALERKRLLDAERVYLKQIEDERARSERLLLNVLPRPIADRLKGGETLIVDSFEEVTVLFADLVGFTRLAEQLSPPLMVRSLDLIFTAFDELASRHGLEKIKTIGDAYMAVAGLPSPRPDHAEAAARMALDMLVELARYNQAHETTLQMRIGMNTGPVVAGVIGRHKFTYDLWGDTVNTASRMESHGEPGTIQITEATAAKLADRFVLRRRGLVDIKGKGELTTFLLIGPRS